MILQVIIKVMLLNRNVLASLNADTVRKTTDLIRILRTIDITLIDYRLG